MQKNINPLKNYTVKKKKNKAFICKKNISPLKN